MRIAVIGTGYVGLVSAACFAQLGHDVVGVDADVDKVQALQRGAVPIFEAGLQPLVASRMAQGNLRFTHRPGEALDGAQLVIIAVGTPSDASGATDLTALRRAVDDVGRALMRPSTVALKSTVPVGTCDAMEAALRLALDQRGLRWRVPVLSNPEFLREGTATEDFLNPDRIVVGARRRRDARVLERAFAPLTRRGVPMIVMSTRSAELSKYAANTMLAARISFMNEMADIAEATGADIEEVRCGIGSDVRIGPSFLKAGIGYGGSCFPKDVSSLMHEAAACGISPEMLVAVARTNERHRRWPLARLIRAYGGPSALDGLRVAVWGLAFKPGTDDLREAASLSTIEALLAQGAFVTAYDPVAMCNAVDIVKPRERLAWAACAADALAGADVLLLLTEWPEFVDFPPTRVAELLRDRLVLDGRNALPVSQWSAAGLRVLQVGRPEWLPRPSVKPITPSRDAGVPQVRAEAAAGTS